MNPQELAEAVALEGRLLIQQQQADRWNAACFRMQAVLKGSRNRRRNALYEFVATEDVARIAAELIDAKGCLDAALEIVVQGGAS